MTSPSRLGFLLACSSLWIVSCGGQTAPQEAELSGPLPESADQELTAEQAERIQALEAIGYAAGTIPAEEGRARDVTLHDTARAAAGTNLVVSGHGPEVVLMDMAGTTLHLWRREFEQVWPDRARYERGGNGEAFRRAHLLAGGELLAIFEGLGLVKLDRDSRVLWAYDGRAHHDLDVGPDGTIYVLTRSARVLRRYNKRKPILEDFVTLLRPDGSEVRSVSLIKCFEGSGLERVMQEVTAGGDVFHTNTLMLLDGGHTQRLPAFTRGRLLVSLRQTDTLAVVDLDRESVPWSLHGSWRAQHQPELLENGNLILFDNYGTPGRSSVLELDPATGRTVWSYQADEPGVFYSRTCGSCQRLSNGNTLITESGNGRAFEVTPGKVLVWEYMSPHRVLDPDMKFANLRARKLAEAGQEFVANLYEVVRLEEPQDWLD